VPPASIRRRASFDAVFQATGGRILRTAVKAPRMNAICERLVGILRREFLDRVLILGERHLRAVLTEYQAHYNTARPHQDMGQRVPDDGLDAPRATVTDIDTQQIRRKHFRGVQGKVQQRAGRAHHQLVGQPGQ
jgi:putative transposase